MAIALVYRIDNAVQQYIIFVLYRRHVHACLLCHCAGRTEYSSSTKVGICQD